MLCILQDSDDYEGVNDTYAYLKEVKQFIKRVCA